MISNHIVQYDFHTAPKKFLTIEINYFHKATQFGSVNIMESNLGSKTPERVNICIEMSKITYICIQFYATSGTTILIETARGRTRATG